MGKNITIGVASVGLAGFLCAGMALPSTAETIENGIRMTPHAIVDSEGFGEPIDAVHLLLPADWTVESRIAWKKKCSGNELAEIVLSAQSPDGRYAFAIEPSHLITNLEYRMNWATMTPQTAEIYRGTAAKIERDMAIAAEQWRGTNCHVASPHGAVEVVRRYLLPRRPKGAWIVDTTPQPEVRQLLLQLMHETNEMSRQLAAQTGGHYSFDADVVQVRIGYQTDTGPMDEDIFVGISGFVSRSPLLGMDANLNTTTAGEQWHSMGSTMPIYAARAPVGEIDKMAPMFGAIFASIRTNPAWNAAMAQVRANIQKIRAKGFAERQRIWRQTMQEISDMQMDSWRQSQESSDKIAESFIDYIRDEQDMADPESDLEIKLPIGPDYWTDGTDLLVIFEPGADIPSGFRPMVPAGG